VESLVWHPEELPEEKRLALALLLQREGVAETTLQHCTGYSTQEAAERLEHVKTQSAQERVQESCRSQMATPADYGLQMPLFEGVPSADESVESEDAEGEDGFVPPASETRVVAFQELSGTYNVGEESESIEAAPSPPDLAFRHQLWQEKEPEDKDDHVEHQEAISLPGISGWRLIGASRRGLLHAHEGRYREDTFAIAVEAGWHLVAVADGAGSAKLSRVGAKTAVQATLRFLCESLNQKGEDAKGDVSALQEALRQALALAAAELEQEASRRSTAVRELATTLLILAHRPTPEGHDVVTAQVGDGSVVAWSPSRDVLALAKPEQGQFAGETQFLTNALGPSELAARVRVEEGLPKDARLFLVMTDGVADDFSRRRSS